MFLIPNNQPQPQPHPCCICNDKIEAEDVCVVKILDIEESEKYQKVVKTWQRNLIDAIENQTRQAFNMLNYRTRAAHTLWHDSFMSLQAISEALENSRLNPANTKFAANRYIAAINTSNGILEAICFFCFSESNEHIKEIQLYEIATNPNNFHSERINSFQPPTKGAASLIVKKIIKIGNQNKAKQIRLTSSPTAIDFFRKNGFVQNNRSKLDFTMLL